MGISGQVLNTEGKPVRGAIIHVWVADPSGKYDNQDENGNPLPLPPEQHKLRGRISAWSDDGTYQFYVLRPGNYPLDAKGTRMRPAHIHVKVEAPFHRTLVTQLYFLDDPFNKRDLKDKDPRTGKSRKHLFFQPELIVQLKPGMPGQTEQQGIFNFVLKRDRDVQEHVSQIVKAVSDGKISEQGPIQDKNIIADSLKSAFVKGIKWDSMIRRVNRRLLKEKSPYRVKLTDVDYKSMITRAGRSHRFQATLSLRSASAKTEIDTVGIRFVSTFEDDFLS